jgi:hypothetical protein
MIILKILFSVGILLTASILIGELFAGKNKQSKFYKWWRKHIIGDFNDL